MKVLVKLCEFYRKIRRILHTKHQLRGVALGKENYVFGDIDIIEPSRLNIGEGCTFNHGSYINASNGIIIGNDVTVSAKASIISTGINYSKWIEGDKCHISEGNVFIGDHVWIGANAIVLPGVSITGEYVVIAANSVVTKNITESRCVYAGMPAVKIKDI